MPSRRGLWAIIAGAIAAPFVKPAEAVPLAERWGWMAVTRDTVGNVAVESPYAALGIGSAARAYERAMRFAAIAEGSTEARRVNEELRLKYRDNPEGYLIAATAFRDKLVKQYTDAGGPAVGEAIGAGIDREIEKGKA